MEGVSLNKFMAMSVVVLLLFDVAYSATKCIDLGVQFQPCLADFQANAATPSTACCSGLAAIQSYEAELGVNPACNCTKGLMLQIPGLKIDVQYAANIQSGCSVSLGFSLATDSSC